MPYVSKAQQGFFHSPSGMKQIGAAEVAKWDRESKGTKNLPEKVGVQGNIKAQKSLQSLFKRK